MIDKPENIEQALRNESAPGSQVVGRDDEMIYFVDITVHNSGNQAAVIAEISVEITEVFEPEYCGSAQGGGGGLFVQALYDFEFEDLTVAAELPVEITKSTRLEVPSRENTRMELSIGPKYKSESDTVKAYAFNTYLREAGNENTVLLGRGKSLTSVEDADGFANQVPELAKGQEECMRQNAEEVSRIVTLPGATSPKLIELNNVLKQYR